MMPFVIIIMYIPYYIDIIFFPQKLIGPCGIDFIFGAEVFNWFPLSSSMSNLRFVHN